MKEYKVKFLVEHEYEFEVEADNESDAEELAFNIASEYIDDLEYISRVIVKEKEWIEQD